LPERIAVPANQAATAKAFEYTRVLRETAPRHTIYDLRYPSPVVSPHEANNTVPAELYLPAGVTRQHAFPAVVCLHILHDDFELERMLCTQLAQSGLIAMFFKQPYYGERGGAGGKELLATGADVFTGSLEQGLEDARRAVDILQGMPEVDPARIGITGISMGAIQSASVCGREPRIQKAFLMLVGCDLRKIILTAHETERVRTLIGGLPAAEQDRVWACIDRVDPIHAQAALRKLGVAGNLRMVCAEKDEVVPPDCGRRLAEAAGFADRVTWLPGLGHYTAMAAFPQILKDVVAFFGADVPRSWHPAEVSGGKTPAELVGVFLSGLAAFAGGQPVAGRAHLVGAVAEVEQGGRTYRAEFDYARGDQGRFKLEGEFPGVGKAGFGQGGYPWLASGKTVFCGTLEPQAGRQVEALIAPEEVMRYRVAVGLLSGVALSPEALKQYYTLAELPGTNGQRVVELRLDYKQAKGTARFTFAGEATPLGLEWNFGELRGKVRFSHWRLNSPADPALFDAPAGRARKEVRQENLARLIGSALEFTMEAMK